MPSDDKGVVVQPIAASDDMDSKFIELVNKRLEKLEKKLNDLNLHFHNQTETSKIEIGDLQKRTLSIVNET